MIQAHCPDVEDFKTVLNSLISEKKPHQEAILLHNPLPDVPGHPDGS